VRRTLTAIVALAATVALLPAAQAAAQPTPPPAAGTGVVERTIAGMTLEEKVGQLFVPYVYGAAVDQPHAANRTLYGVDTVGEVIERYKVGGIIYFGWSGNLVSPRQIAELSNGIQRRSLAQPAGVPALLSIDQEEGVVVRLPQPSTQLPGTMALGATGSAAHARAAAGVTARELRAVGVSQNYAPVADVNVNAFNPVIGVRSFGADSGLVADLVDAQVRGHQEQQVSSTAKHFPGHGNTDVDSHVGLPVIPHTRAEFEAIDLPPFAAAVAAGVDAIMTAHIVVPALDDSGRPATLSEPILTGVLREELGFDGVIVTDALTMAGVRSMFGDDRVPVEALKAGADQMLMPPDLGLAIDAVVAAVHSGELTERRIEESVRRILHLKWKRGLYHDPYVDPDAVAGALATPEHRAVSAAVAEDSITVLHDDADVLPIEPGARVLVTGWGAATTTALADGLRQHGHTVTRMLASDPDDTRIAEVRAAADAHDVVVATTMASAFAPSQAQQRLVASLAGGDTPTVTVAVRNPYDVASLAPVAASVVTYGYATDSLLAAARVLTGAAPANGRLPVAVPTADATSVLYPLGHGVQP
jgi:beta-N-acetylhexosaminidase